MSDSLVIGILTVLASIVVSSVGVLSARRQVRAKAEVDTASAAKYYTEASTELLEPYKKEVEGLRAQVAELRGQVEVQAAVVIKQASEINTLTARLKKYQVLEETVTRQALEISQQSEKIGELTELSVLQQTEVSRQGAKIAELQAAYDSLVEENARLRAENESLSRPASGPAASSPAVSSEPVGI